MFSIRLYCDCAKINKIEKWNHFVRLITGPRDSKDHGVDLSVFLHGSIFFWVVDRFSSGRDTSCFEAPNCWRGSELFDFIIFFTSFFFMFVGGSEAMDGSGDGVCSKTV